MILTKQQIQETIENYFKDKPVKKVYLFGSYARGEATEGSDVDLLVDLDYEKKIGLQFLGWYDDLEKIMKKKVDILSEQSLRTDRLVTKFIHNQKVLLYARSA